MQDQHPSKQIINIKLLEENSNWKIQLELTKTKYHDFQIVSEGYYYPYNQKYEDFGWGCAWRAIQTMLSVFDITIDFKQLVQKYRRKQYLIKIMERYKSPFIQEIRQLKWAPEQNSECWAEPFISKLICEDHKLKTQLYLVNGYPNSYAPECVYQQVLSFSQFWLFISHHIPKSTVMIDDGQLALSIIGFKQIGQNQKALILADPHITSNKNNNKIGIYKVVLDNDGKQLNNDAELDSDFYPFSSHKKIYFDTKKWMVMTAYMPSSQ